MFFGGKAGSYVFAWGCAGFADSGNKTAATLGDGWAHKMGVYLGPNMALPAP